jgi:hypothetical protein
MGAGLAIIRISRTPLLLVKVIGSLRLAALKVSAVSALAIEKRGCSRDKKDKCVFSDD